MFRSAAQGDSKSQRQLLELITRAEADRAIAARDDAEWLIKYQAWAEEQIADHQRRGREPPELYLHPDDIIFNVTTGAVTIDGPLTKEQAGAQKTSARYVFEKALHYFEIEEKLKSDPRNRKLKKELAEHEQYLDYINRHGERKIRLEVLKLSRDALNLHPVRRKKRQLSAEDPKPGERNNS
jgi:hypothetical protein